MEENKIIADSYEMHGGAIDMSELDNHIKNQPPVVI